MLLSIISATVTAAAVEFMPVEKSPVVVFINGKKFFIHTVKQGDTLYSIAKAYQVQEDVLRANNTGIADGLRIDLMDTPIRVTCIEPGLVETEFSIIRFRGDKDKAKAV